MSAWLQNEDLREIWSLSNLNRSPTVPSSRSSQSPVSLTANCSTLDSFHTGKPAAMDSNKNNASVSCVWHADTDPNSNTGKLTARSKKITVGQNLFPHNFAILPDNVDCMQKVFTYVRQKLGRPKEDKMEHVNTNAMIWGLFKNASVKSTVHLGKDSEEFCLSRRTQISPRFGLCSTLPEN